MKNTEKQSIFHQIQNWMQEETNRCFIFWYFITHRSQLSFSLLINQKDKNQGTENDYPTAICTTQVTELVPHIYPNLNSLTLTPSFFQSSSIFICKQFHPVLNSPRQSFVQRELSNLRHLNSPSLKYKGENKIGLKIPCTKYIKFHEDSQGTSALKFAQFNEVTYENLLIFSLIPSNILLLVIITSIWCTYLHIPWYSAKIQKATGVNFSSISYHNI